MNLEQETRRGYTISKEMKKVWALEMEILKKLLEVCEKHHLRAWADGGTLLGTVREHGFIPWDDDIDIAMLRDDYDKLVAVAKEEFKPPFFLQNGHTDNFWNGFSKLRMDGTAGITRNSYRFNFHQGIFIDIFPYDAVPEGTGAPERQNAKGSKMRRELFNYWGDDASPCHPMELLTSFRDKWHVRLKGARKIYKEMEDLYRQYKISDHGFVACSAFIYDLPHFKRDKHWYDETLYMPFEDMMMPVPSGYDSILRTQYGDYMTPKDSGSYHGGFLALDTEHSYEELLPAIRKEHRWDDWKHRWNVIRGRASVEKR